MKETQFRQKIDSMKSNLSLHNAEQEGIMPRKTRRPMLKISSQGAAVSKLQGMLRELDYTINDRPGFFGVDTRNAVMDIQSSNGLTKSGSGMSY